MRFVSALLHVSLFSTLLPLSPLGPTSRGRRSAVLLAPTVDVAAANSGADIERSACVSVASRPGVAYECGDLRLTYDLPSIRYRNQTRTPSLLYNSQHAKPTPIVRAWVTNPTGGTVPSTVTVTLVVLQGGSQGSYVQRASQAWGPSSWTLGGQRQVVLSFDATDLATGLYPYRLEVRFSDGSGTQMTSATGQLAIVNRTTSEFGREWWLAGLERLLPVSDGTGDRFWIGGDGSTRRYVRMLLDVRVTGRVVPERVLGQRDAGARRADDRPCQPAGVLVIGRDALAGGVVPAIGVLRAAPQVSLAMASQASLVVRQSERRWTGRITSERSPEELRWTTAGASASTTVPLTTPELRVRWAEMVFLCECAHGPAAERLGVPLGTLKTRVRLGLRRMRVLFDDSGVTRLMC